MHKRNLVFLAILILSAIIAGGCGQAKPVALTKMTGEDVAALFKTAPPETLQRAASDPKLIEDTLKQIKDILAIAAEARKQGIADEPEMKTQLEFLASQIVAIEYDREQTGEKAAGPPFAKVTAEEVEAMMKEAGNETKFNGFVEVVKERVAKNAQPGAPPQELKEEQLKTIRDMWGKTFVTERKAKAAGFDKKREIQTQIAVQQASLLAQELEKRKNKEFEVSDAALAEYVKTHPEYDLAPKRAKIEEILKRAKAGEDFAKLADENTEDPGNKDQKTGKTNGGLYENTKKGAFVPQFEQAALALEKGGITDVVETDYGFHIIKLIDKKMQKGADGKEEQVYSVRHILISTSAPPDPRNPFGKPGSLKDAAKNSLKKEQRDKWVEELLAKYQITVPAASEVKIEAPPMPAPPVVTDAPANTNPTAPGAANSNK